ncbi:MAG: cysteine desulfurase family protein [Deltaproteobacteria bacterium]
MIYLDNNATTRPLPEVVDCMTRHWRESFANPGSRHAAGRRARQVLETARESMAAILGAHPDELIFTSGGTESNNMAILGLTAGPPGTIALSAGEHPAVMETCRFLQTKGWRLSILPVDEDGLVNTPLRPLAKGGKTSAAAEDHLHLLTLILAHNETGVIQDVRPVAAECTERGIPFHVDAVQAVGKIPVNFHDLGVTSLALGAHKFYGPRGIGALLLKRGVKLAPSAFGGHQESGRRPGTEVVPLIAGMTKALEMFHAEQEQRLTQTRMLRDLLEQRLASLCPPVVLNGSRERRLPNTLNIAFPGVDGEALLVALDLAGIACSLGSTCASGSAEPAPVLLAMNRPKEVWHSSVRFSVGIENTTAEIEQAAATIAATVNRLRASK